MVAEEGTACTGGSAHTPGHMPPCSHGRNDLPLAHPSKPSFSPEGFRPVMQVNDINNSKCPTCPLCLSADAGRHIGRAPARPYAFPGASNTPRQALPGSLTALGGSLFAGELLDRLQCPRVTGTTPTPGQDCQQGSPHHRRRNWRPRRPDQLINRPVAAACWPDGIKQAWSSTAFRPRLRPMVMRRGRHLQGQEGWRARWRGLLLSRPSICA